MQSPYTQDVEFASRFDALQAPVQIYSAAVLAGIAAKRVDRAFRYLDLACGNGLTLVILADCYPHAEFVGVDINPDHIERARGYAAEAGVSNICFELGDVLTLDPGLHGAFDYIAASGVYSWLDAERRAALRRFAAAAAAPAGLVYLDYSAQPGVAQTAPLYRMLQQIGAAMEGGSGERLTQAAQVADALRKSGAQFFSVNPLASRRLDTILANPPQDEAHEVFNLREGGLWSGEVVASMAEDGLTYLASAGLHLNLPRLTARPDALEALAHLPAPVRESCADVVWNVHQRRDIYVRDGGTPDRDAAIDGLADLPLYVQPGALEAANLAHVARQLPHYDFGSSPAQSLARHARGAADFGALFEAMRGDGLAEPEIRDVVRHFLGARLIAVAAAPPPPPATGTRYAIPSQLNRHILEADIGDEFVRPFSSPVAGSQVALPLKDRIYLWALLGMDLDKAWDRMPELRDGFRDKDNRPLDRAGFARVIGQSLDGFRTRIAPELHRLGVLAEA